MTEILTNGFVCEDRNGVVIQTTRPPVDNLSEEVLVVWKDSRSISQDQRKKAWALMSEIAEFQGESKEDVYREQQIAFSTKSLDVLQGKLFHLSSASMSEAKQFIDLLVEIVVEFGIPTKKPLVEYCEDIGKFVYACLLNKRCCVCGKPGELHHVDHVGNGRDRLKINHIGMECLPLCREHHTEAHTMGKDEFLSKYHLQTIRIDERIARKYRLNWR